MASIQVGSTPVQVVTVPWGQLLVQNLGAGDVHFGRTAAVTTATGIRIAPGGHLIVEMRGSHASPWWLVAATPQDVRWEVVG